VVLVVVGLLAAACSSSSDTVDQAGPCDIKPGTVCRNESLQGVSMVAADLRGADFSGSDLSNADLRNADLTDAKLVKAQLGGANLTGASLKGANLTGATLFSTNLTGADMSGAIKTSWYTCNVTQPDGALVAGDCPDSTGGSIIPVAKAPTGPPVITFFRPEAPARCLNDASGPGIEVEWSAQNVTALSFAVNGIRIDGGAVNATGTQRLPFICDGKPHPVEMQAFGSQSRVATASFNVALRNTAPLAPPGS
jgi:hypothetical protein